MAGSKWHPEGRAPFPTPVAKLRFHARCLHTLLTDRPERKELKAIWVEPAVLLRAVILDLQSLLAVDTVQVDITDHRPRGAVRC